MYDKSMLKSVCTSDVQFIVFAFLKTMTFNT